jgi:hypothetical protein
MMPIGSADNLKEQFGSGLREGMQPSVLPGDFSSTASERDILIKGMDKED